MYRAIWGHPGRYLEDNLGLEFFSIYRAYLKVFSCNVAELLERGGCQAVGGLAVYTT